MAAASAASAAAKVRKTRTTSSIPEIYLTPVWLSATLALMLPLDSLLIRDHF
jgi:hypothetical protein